MVKILSMFQKIRKTCVVKKQIPAYVSSSDTVLNDSKAINP